MRWRAAEVTRLGRSLFSQLVEWERRVRADPTLHCVWPTNGDSLDEDDTVDVEARREAQDLDRAMRARRVRLTAEIQ